MQPDQYQKQLPHLLHYAYIANDYRIRVLCWKLSLAIIVLNTFTVHVVLNLCGQTAEEQRSS